MAQKKYDIKPSSKSEVALLLAMMGSTTKMWRGELRGMADAELRWQAAKGGHSIGMIILHCAIAEYWWIQGVAKGKKIDMKFINGLGYKRMDIANGVYGTPLRKPKAWYLKQMTDIRKRTKTALRGLKPAHIGVGRGGSKFTLRWILHHLIEHEAYHGGQMVLLRELYKKRKKR